MQLDPLKYYVFVRVGSDTSSLTQEVAYVAQYCQLDKCWKLGNDRGGAQKTPHHVLTLRKYYSCQKVCDTFKAAKLYAIEYNDCSEETPKYAQEYERDLSTPYRIVRVEPMSEFISSDEALEVTDAVLVNGSDVTNFSDKALIKMIQAEQEKASKLMAITFTSTKVQAKVAKMEANVVRLIAILDARP